MAIDVLLRFLKQNLLDVGSDDTKFERLQNTADELAKGLSEAPGKTIGYSLFAVDPKAPETDPVFGEVVSVLEQKWVTYSNTFAARPVNVVRALLLAAIAKTAAENNAVGVALVSLVRNTLPLMEVGSESLIWADVVSEIEKTVDARAEREWSTPSSIAIGRTSLPAVAATPVTIKPAAVDLTDLNTRILAATGPYASGDQNPHHANQPQPWAAEFSKRLAQTIADTINGVVAPLNGKPIDIAPTLQGVTNGVADYVERAMAEVSLRTAGLQRRTNLLWWKEAVYSQSAHTSYRELPSFVAAALMAYDLHLQVPTFSPASVAALLREAVEAQTPARKDEKRSIRELVEEAKNAPSLAEFRNAVAKVAPVTDGRGPIVSIIGSVRGIGSDDEFIRLAGVRPDTSLKAYEWALWIFRELQAVRAVGTSAATAGAEG